LVIIETPKRHILGLNGKPHLHANFGGDRSTGATWARAEGIKKKKKKEKKRGKKLFLAPFSH